MDLKNLNYFIGKVCTIFTVPINREYQKENPGTYPQQLYTYFVGVVESINEYGIMLKQLQSKNKSFYFVSHIIGIAEEEVLDPENNAEEIEKIKAVDAEYRTAMTSIKPPADDGEFVDPKEIEEMMKQMS